MYIEIISTILIFSLAVFIIYRKFVRKPGGSCGSCSSCSKDCPYNKGNNSKK